MNRESKELPKRRVYLIRPFLYIRLGIVGLNARCKSIVRKGAGIVETAVDPGRVHSEMIEWHRRKVLFLTSMSEVMLRLHLSAITLGPES